MKIQTAGPGDDAQLGPNGSLVATPNQTMAYIGVGREKLYQLINEGELESYTEGSSRKILWPSIHALVKRRLAAEAARRGRAA
jgi:excisionase family DNA binding protein